MQAIMETLFDAVYLITVITLGVIMIRKNQGKRQYLLFGIMAGQGMRFIWCRAHTRCAPPGWKTTRLPWESAS